MEGEINPIVQQEQIQEPDIVKQPEVIKPATYSSIENLVIENEIKPENRSFDVFLPGFFGGGKGLTELRKNTGMFVPSSISTRESFKNDEKSLGDHYRNLTQEILQNAGNKDLTFYCHSLGCLEVNDVLQLMSNDERAKGKNIQIVLMAAPQSAEYGFKSLGNFVEKTQDFLKNVTVYEQHIAYPLPEAMYEDVKDDKEASEFLGVVKDTPEKRQKRKQKFASNLKKIVPIDEDRNNVEKRLEQIDESLLKNDVDDVEKQALYDERIKILHPLIEQLFQGNNFDDAEVHEMMEKYRELSSDLSTPLRYKANFALYMGKAMDDVMYGSVNNLIDTAEKMKEKDIKASFAFALMEQDVYIKKEDIEKIKVQFDEKNAKEMLSGFFFMEKLAHSSIGYDSDPLVELRALIEKMKTEEK
jgi:hypothetical protein